jgi:hypothetical protein
MHHVWTPSEAREIDKNMDAELNQIGEKLIRRATRDERRLLEREAEAELELKQALARLSRSETRLQAAQAEAARRARAVARAEATLLACQTARAGGPAYPVRAASPTAPPVAPETSDAPPRRTNRPRRQPAADTDQPA